MIMSFKGVIHKVRTHSRGGERSSQMRTIAHKEGGWVFQGCVRAQKIFWDRKISKRFVQKELLHCHLLL